MIELRTGDLFESGADVLINPVNTLGIAGKGLAKQFAIRFPDHQLAYGSMARAGHLKTGAVLATLVNRIEPGQPYIVHFPTKEHWRNPSKAVWIKAGLVSLRNWLKEYPHIRTIAMPALGCGLGGLDFETEVLPMIRHEFDVHPVTVYVYPPQ